MLNHIIVIVKGSVIGDRQPMAIIDDAGRGPVQLDMPV